MPKDQTERSILYCESEAVWEAWLQAHSTDAQGVWLKMAKKETGIPSVNYQQAVDVALCYGWIDGQKDRWDEQYWLQKFTPRRAKSIWSKINREKVERLIAEGRMQPAGLAQVEQAKADGRWDAAYDSQRTITVPPDLLAQLEANPAAKAFFETLNSANRYAFLYQIQTAKKPETRANRIEKIVGMLNRGEKLYP